MEQNIELVNGSYEYEIPVCEETIVNGTFDYERLENKPKINEVELIGNKSLEDLGIDQDFVKDSNYVHTDNNYTTTEKDKLSSLQNYNDSKIREDINTNKTNIEKNIEDIVTLNSKVNANSENINNNTEKITTLESTISDDKNIINSHTEKINELDSNISTNKADIKAINDSLNKYSLSSETGNKIALNVNSDYVVEIELQNKKGEVLSKGNIDLPIEQVVMDMAYDNDKKNLIITLENGVKREIPIGAIVSGLVSETTMNEKLESKADKSNIPTKVGQLENDKGYLSEHQDLSNYVKNTDYATNSKAGIIITGNGFGTNSGITYAGTYGIENYNTKGKGIFISKGTLENRLAPVETKNTEQDKSIEKLNSELQELQEENEELKGAMVTGSVEDSDIHVEDSSEMKNKSIVVSGDVKQKTTDGKNLWKFGNANFTPTSATWYDTAGRSGMYGGNISNSIHKFTLKSGTYTLSYGLKSNIGSIGIVDLNEKAIVGIASSSTQKNASFTLSEETTMVLRFQVNTANTPISLANIQIEKGNTATTYEPYTGEQPSPNPDYPQEIKVVTGDVEVKVQNKNYFNSYKLESVSSGSQNTSTTIINENNLRFENWGSWSRRVFKISKLKPNTEYTISALIVPSLSTIGGFFIDDKFEENAFSKVGNTSKKIYQTFISSENGDKNITFYTNWSGTSNSDNVYFEKIQLELGNKVSEYVPHQEQSYPLSLGNLEMLKDEYFFKENGKWYLKKFWGKIVLDGSENWSFVASSNRPFRLNRTDYGVLSTSQNITPNIYCNIYKIYSWNGLSSENTGITYDPNIQTQIAIRDINYSTLADYKKYLQKTKPVLYYLLKNETDTEITDENLINQLNALQKARTYKGVTNISSDTENLNPIIKLDYYKDLGIVINNLESAILGS